MPEKPSYEELHQKVIDLERSIDTYRPLVENSSDLFYRTSSRWEDIVYLAFGL
jgi:hypothetical protein